MDVAFPGSCNVMATAIVKTTVMKPVRVVRTVSWPWHHSRMWCIMSILSHWLPLKPVECTICLIFQYACYQVSLETISTGFHTTYMAKCKWRRTVVCGRKKDTQRNCMYAKVDLMSALRSWKILIRKHMCSKCNRCHITKSTIFNMKWKAEEIPIK